MKALLEKQDLCVETVRQQYKAEHQVSDPEHLGSRSERDPCGSERWLHGRLEI